MKMRIEDIQDDEEAGEQEFRSVATTGIFFMAVVISIATIIVSLIF